MLTQVRLPLNPIAVQHAITHYIKLPGCKWFCVLMEKRACCFNSFQFTVFVWLHGISPRVCGALRQSWQFCGLFASLLNRLSPLHMATSLCNERQVWAVPSAHYIPPSVWLHHHSQTILSTLQRLISAKRKFLIPLQKYFVVNKELCTLANRLYFSMNWNIQVVNVWDISLCSHLTK